MTYRIFDRALPDPNGDATRTCPHCQRTRPLAFFGKRAHLAYCTNCRTAKRPHLSGVLHETLTREATR